MVLEGVRCTCGSAVRRRFIITIPKCSNEARYGWRVLCHGDARVGRERLMVKTLGHVRFSKIIRIDDAADMHLPPKGIRDAIQDAIDTLGHDGTFELDLEWGIDGGV